MNAIELTDVCKSFGRKKVLEKLDLTVPAGSVYAFLGRNGAGKSTTIKMLAGQLQPDAGTVRVLGLDPVSDAVELRRRTGYVAENQALFNDLSLREYCGFVAKFYTDYNAALGESLIKRFELPTELKLGKFSRGMYSKAALIGALARSPQLLILDDPTLGLDTVARREFIDILRDTLLDFEHTLFISSHILHELEGFCDHAGILRDGKMVVAGEIDRLKSEHFTISLAEGTIAPPLPGEISRTKRPGELHLFLRGDRAETARQLDEQGIAPVTVNALTLEDIFIEYAGKEE